MNAPMDPKLEKIQKLIALALHNPNGEEARSAALKALQLMQACGAIVSLPVPVRPPNPLDGLRAMTQEEMLRRAQRAQQSSRDYQWYENLGSDFYK